MSGAQGQHAVGVAPFLEQLAIRPVRQGREAGTVGPARRLQKERLPGAGFQRLERLVRQPHAVLVKTGIDGQLDGRPPAGIGSGLRSKKGQERADDRGALCRPLTQPLLHEQEAAAVHADSGVPLLGGSGGIAGGREHVAKLERQDALAHAPSTRAEHLHRPA